MLDEVEQALNSSHGVETTDGGIPQAENPAPASAPNGGIGYLDTDNEPVRTSDRRPVDYDG